MLICEDCHGGPAEYPYDDRDLSPGTCERCQRDSNRVDCMTDGKANHAAAAQRLVREDAEARANWAEFVERAVNEPNRGWWRKR